MIFLRERLRFSAKPGATGHLRPCDDRRVFRKPLAFLRHSDLQGALGFLREAEAVTTPGPFPTELLDLLRELVPSESVGCCELDRVTERILYAEGCSRLLEKDREGAISQEEAERVFWSVIRQSPIYAYHDRTKDFAPIKLSDS
jgi:hypothetical protein